MEGELERRRCTGRRLGWVFSGKLRRRSPKILDECLEFGVIRRLDPRPVHTEHFLPANCTQAEAGRVPRGASKAAALNS